MIIEFLFKEEEKKITKKTEVFTLGLKTRAGQSHQSPKAELVARETSQPSGPQPWEARALHILLIVEAIGLLLPE